MISALKRFIGLERKDSIPELLAKGAVILDVRTKREYEAGRLKRSENIPLNLLPFHIPRLRDKKQPIILCCSSGKRSSLAKRILENTGYTNVHNGGSWLSIGDEQTEALSN